MGTSSNDSLMVVCNSNFFVCNKCGFSRSSLTISDKKARNAITEKHQTSFGSDCDG